jgi:hypothetical protein
MQPVKDTVHDRGQDYAYIGYKYYSAEQCIKGRKKLASIIGNVQNGSHTTQQHAGIMEQKPATPIIRLILKMTEATNKFLSTRW